jgi:hypothetical protein
MSDDVNILSICIYLLQMMSLELRDCTKRGCEYFLLTDNDTCGLVFND